MVPKKRPILFFIPKLSFTIFFPYFSGGVDSRPERLFWHQYGSNWTLYYAAADKNHRGILYRKMSSSNKAAMQERFWQEQCTWWKDNSTFDDQILEERKCGWCPQRPKSFIVRHNSWEYSEFTGAPWGIPQKINTREHQFWGSSMMTLSSFLTKFRSWRGKLIKIKQNEKHFMKVWVKGLKMTLVCWIWTIWTISTTMAFVGHLLHFPFPKIWPSNVELSFYKVHCSCRNLSFITTVSKLILWQNTPRWFLSAAA